MGKISKRVLVSLSIGSEHTHKISITEILSGKFNKAKLT
jgi:hypothetical protein